jgi:hypothetical protein
LEVDHLFDSRTTEDMVTPPHALVKLQVNEQRAKIVETDIRVGSASEYPLERFLWPSHGRFSVPPALGSVMVIRIWQPSSVQRWPAAEFVTTFVRKRLDADKLKRRSSWLIPTPDAPSPSSSAPLPA